MKFLRSNLTLVAIAGALISLQACKAKKLPQKSTDSQQTDNTQQQQRQPTQQAQSRPAVTQAPPPAPKPNYNFSNVQFEFNSSVLKTASYPFLDNAAYIMKANPTIKFSLNGYASIEGTEEYNTTLSADRANAVKTYLVNSGVSPDQLIATGYGTANPIADNGNEDGRALNRRVEIHKQ